MCKNHNEKPADFCNSDHFLCKQCYEINNFNGQILNWDLYQQEKIEEFINESIKNLSMRNNEIAELVFELVELKKV